MTISIDWPQPQAIWQYYQNSIEAFAAWRNALSAAAANPAVTIEQTLLELRQELDNEVTLVLTASFEATFQRDMQRRVAKRKKDSLSRKLRKLHRKAEKLDRRVTFEEILDIWQKETGCVQVIGNLKQLIQFRHWLAHGRYWVQKSGLTNPDPFDAWQRGKAVFDALPGFPPLQSP